MPADGMNAAVKLE